MRELWKKTPELEPESRRPPAVSTAWISRRCLGSLQRRMSVEKLELI